MVALDARTASAVDGWSKMTGHDVADLAKKFEDYGVEAIIYTDIGRDGISRASTSTQPSRSPASSRSRLLQAAV